MILSGTTRSRSVLGGRYNRCRRFHQRHRHRAPPESIASVEAPITSLVLMVTTSLSPEQLSCGACDESPFLSGTYPRCSERAPQWPASWSALVEEPQPSAHNTTAARYTQHNHNTIGMTSTLHSISSPHNTITTPLQHHRRASVNTTPTRQYTTRSQHDI